MFRAVGQRRGLIQLPVLPSWCRNKQTLFHPVPLTYGCSLLFCIGFLNFEMYYFIKKSGDVSTFFRVLWKHHAGIETQRWHLRPQQETTLK